MRLMSLQERKDVSIKILSEISSICRNNNIKYFLAYGTLLGAVRHGGFIPWDDDIDIIIPIEDFFKFLECMEKESIYDTLVYKNNNGWDLLFAKISDPTTTLKEQGSDEYTLRGVAVDVFPMVNFVSSEWYGKVQKWGEVLMSYRRFDSTTGIKAFLKKALRELISEDIVYRAWKNEIMKGAENTNYSKCAAMFSPYAFEKTIYNKEWFEPIKMKFEKMEFLAPKGYHEILSQLYGNYMELPPENKRNSGHDVEAYFKE